MIPSKDIISIDEVKSKIEIFNDEITSRYLKIVDIKKLIILEQNTQYPLTIDKFIDIPFTITQNIRNANKGIESTITEISSELILFLSYNIYVNEMILNYKKFSTSETDNYILTLYELYADTSELYAINTIQSTINHPDGSLNSSLNILMQVEYNISSEIQCYVENNDLLIIAEKKMLSVWKYPYYRISQYTFKKEEGCPTTMRICYDSQINKKYNRLIIEYHESMIIYSILNEGMTLEEEMSISHILWFYDDYNIVHNYVEKDDNLEKISLMFM